MAGESRPVSSSGEEQKSENAASSIAPAAEPSHHADRPSTVSTFRFSLIIFALCLAVFLCGLDQTILATAVPRITDEFHALDDIGWYSAAYLLTLSTFQLFYGKLYTFFPLKIVYLCAVGLFEIGSIICAVAPSSSTLIGGRAIAGLGGAGIFSGSILVLANVVPLEKRAAYTGAVSGMFGIAAIAGPFIGGALTDRSTWRWCFGINPLIGLVTFVVIAIFIKSPPPVSLSMSEKVWQFDLPGTTALVGSIVCLLLAMQWGGSTFPWNNGRIIALLVLFGIFLLAFIAIQVFSKSLRTFSTALVRNRSVWFASLYALCVSGAVYVAVIYLPVWFQAVKGASALQSGLMIAPIIIGYVVFAMIGGIGTSAIGYYNPVMLLSPILASIGSGLITTFEPSTRSPFWIGVQALYGFGVGFGLQMPVLVAQTVLSPSDVPIGVALMTLMQNLGGSVFAAMAQSIFQNLLVANLHNVAPSFSPTEITQVGATNITQLFPEQDAPVVLQAYSDAVTRTLLVVLVLSCISFIGAVGVEWKRMQSPSAATDEVEESEKLETA